MADSVGARPPARCATHGGPSRAARASRYRNVGAGLAQTRAHAIHFFAKSAVTN
ncbi:hypothetical protein C7S16_5930 [Burkholderia thailandensis]|uniref:Histidine kinase n=1 Tax=Burkholderia thailandensis TaxID=57975 RepID=A0AAW9CMD5_BURTH|nr:hypothetical protein [Burkholderia thailandensis]MDW9252115.1 hypothetical protein [Burkholderia thailandensis]